MPDYTQEELDRIDRGDVRPSTYEEARKTFQREENRPTDQPRAGASTIQRLGNILRFGRGTDRDQSRRDSGR